MLNNNPELKSKFDQLWNKFWSVGIPNPLDNTADLKMMKYVPFWA